MYIDVGDASNQHGGHTGHDAGNQHGGHTGHDAGNQHGGYTGHDSTFMTTPDQPEVVVQQSNMVYL